MSYQARMLMPLLTVTGRTGAFGKMKRGATQSGRRSSGTSDTKSVPSAPSPCIQMTLVVGEVAGLMTTASRRCCVSYRMRECYDVRMANAPLDYRSAGVDYDRIDALKIRAQQAARGTARHLAGHGAREIASSRGESAYVVERHGGLLASIVECLGTKSLVADAMRAISGRSHYDSIAQDTIAMAVNDLVTVGAAPTSVHAYWAAGGSDWFSDIQRMEDLVRGWQSACDVCEVSWGGGETPALAGVVAPGSIDLAASCVGIVPSRDHLTLGDSLGAGDAIVLVASSGIHANGVSLARKLAQTLPRGYATLLSD